MVKPGGEIGRRGVNGKKKRASNVFHNKNKFKNKRKIFQVQVEFIDPMIFL